jgi:hypothetical protein
MSSIGMNDIASGVMICATRVSPNSRHAIFAISNLNLRHSIARLSFNMAGQI